MKRLAVGALFVSLLVGSIAMAGQGSRGPNNRNDHSDNRGGRHDDNRGDHNRRNDNRRDGHDRHDSPRQHWNNDHGRNDGNRGNDHRRDWNRNAPRYNYAPAPRYRYAPPRHDFNRPRFNYGAYHRPHGYYSHSWGRGERLPRACYASHYVVRDYDRCGLRHPPYGYHWVRVDSDVVLAAIATGVILDVVYNQFYG